MAGFEALEVAVNGSLWRDRLENMFEYSCLPARYVTDHFVCNHSLPCSQRFLFASSEEASFEDGW